MAKDGARVSLVGSRVRRALPMSKKPPMDPNIEPPGYKPPTSAEELLERYEKGEIYYTEATVLLYN